MLPLHKPSRPLRTTSSGDLWFKHNIQIVPCQPLILLNLDTQCETDIKMYLHVQTIQLSNLVWLNQGLYSLIGSRKVCDETLNEEQRQSTQAGKNSS